MAWQYAFGIIIGGGILGVLAIAATRIIPPGTYVGLLGLAAAVGFMGTEISRVKSLVGLLGVHGGGDGFEVGGRDPAWWCLVGLIIGAVVTIGVIRGDEGEPSGARASTPRFLALVGLVLTVAATAPGRFGGFGHDTKDTLVLVAGVGVALALAAIAFGTRADQPESPAYVALTTAVAAALVSLLVSAIDSSERFAPLVMGLGAVPLLVGGLFALAGLIRPLAEGSGRRVTGLVTAGLGVLIVDELLVNVILGDKGAFASLIFFGGGFGFFGLGS
jgi:hypothetical protein